MRRTGTRTILGGWKEDGFVKRLSGQLLNAWWLRLAWGKRSHELAPSFRPGAHGNRTVIYLFGGNSRRTQRVSAVLRALNLIWDSWRAGPPPRRKVLGSQGAVRRGLAVGPAGMCTTEPESSVGNRSSDLCPLPGTGVTTLSVGPHCLRGCQLILWSFKTRVISNSLQVREAYQCVLGVLLLLLLLLAAAAAAGEGRGLPKSIAKPLGGILTLEGGAGVAGEGQPRASWRCQV